MKYLGRLLLGITAILGLGISLFCFDFVPDVTNVNLTGGSVVNEGLPHHRGAIPLARPGQTTMYDEQVACSFVDNLPALSYSINAVAQSGTDGYGPAYL